jgi:hypothetical protein
LIAQEHKTMQIEVVCNRLCFLWQNAHASVVEWDGHIDLEMTDFHLFGDGIHTDSDCEQEDEHPSGKTVLEPLYH